MGREDLVRPAVPLAQRAGRARLAWRQFRRSRAGLLGLGIIAGFLLMGLLAPVLAPNDPYEVDFDRSLEPPRRGSPFGRDELGRDMLSRTIYGARVSLVMGVIAVAIGIGVGVPLGALSGYHGGRPDTCSPSGWWTSCWPSPESCWPSWW